MLRHVAVFRFVPEFTHADRTHWINLLHSLQGQVPGLRALTAGENVLPGAAAYEIAVVADFDDRAGLDAYNQHPIHLEILRISAPVKTAIAVVDFEVEDPAPGSE